MKKNRSTTNLLIISLVVIVIIIGSIRFADNFLAIKIMRFLQSMHFMRKATEHIPDLLPYLVCTSTILIWVIYTYKALKKNIDTNFFFLRLAGFSLPASYVLKTFLQYAFGRIPARLWISSPHVVKFSWFHESGGGCFPSGHMTTFTAFGIAILIYYPQYKPQVLLTLAILGLALIATDYHFVSDVIAGAYVGFLTTYLLWTIFLRSRS